MELEGVATLCSGGELGSADLRAGSGGMDQCYLRSEELQSCVGAPGESSGDPGVDFGVDADVHAEAKQQLLARPKHARHTTGIWNSVSGVVVRCLSVIMGGEPISVKDHTE